jgi:hypothetical protein
MAAPTNAANMKKTLANSEPSTHGTSATLKRRGLMSGFEPSSDTNASPTYVAE